LGRFKHKPFVNLERAASLVSFFGPRESLMEVVISGALGRLVGLIGTLPCGCGWQVLSLAA